MKTIIAGSRTITNATVLEEAIKASGFTITEVVCGGARGVDTLGQNWAKQHNIPVKMFPADWKMHGKAAGPIRNAEMAKYGEQAICIFDVQAENKGTNDMAWKAACKGMLVYHHPTNMRKLLE